MPLGVTAGLVFRGILSEGSLVSVSLSQCGCVPGGQRGPPGAPLCAGGDRRPVLAFLGLTAELGELAPCIIPAFLSVLEISPVDRHARPSRQIHKLHFNSGGPVSESRATES